MKKIDDTAKESRVRYVSNSKGKIIGEIRFDDSEGIWTLIRMDKPYKTERYVNFDDAVLAAKSFDFATFFDKYFNFLMPAFTIFTFIFFFYMVGVN